MMTHARTAYMDASVATASPARLLVMLCERLVLDVTRGRDALVAGDREESNRQLVHAQEIILELRASLKVEECDAGPGLASIYDYLHTQLVRANITRDVAMAEGCLSLVSDLCATWREAALLSLSAA
ncbi:flagellar export chaperone FliS [Nocardioides dongkuii]|uniref:flagellar export chaperone FliS n=1 Tax=Nocardioides dongkuii TaxID=2760089 RepID=UPI0015FA1CE3|nr:flagellar export chaperone FliS [Nocardioides dongkuii]